MPTGSPYTGGLNDVRNQKTETEHPDDPPDLVAVSAEVRSSAEKGAAQPVRQAGPEVAPKSGLTNVLASLRGDLYF